MPTFLRSVEMRTIVLLKLSTLPGNRNGKGCKGQFGEHLRGPGPSIWEGCLVKYLGLCTPVAKKVVLTGSVRKTSLISTSRPILLDFPAAQLVGLVYFEIFAAKAICFRLTLQLTN